MYAKPKQVSDLCGIQIGSCSVQGRLMGGLPSRKSGGGGQEGAPDSHLLEHYFFISGANASNSTCPIWAQVLSSSVVMGWRSLAGEY
jgi:hypothetical protein